MKYLLIYSRNQTEYFKLWHVERHEGTGSTIFVEQAHLRHA